VVGGVQTVVVVCTDVEECGRDVVECARVVVVR
jgi:hypothetical protein